MGIIIGANTTATAEFAQVGGGSGCTGATQASWEYTVQRQRLYELGSWSPCAAYDVPQQTLSLTFYSGSTSSWPITPTLTCANDAVWAEVVAAGCNIPQTDGSLSNVGTLGNQSDRDWFITGYSYSKTDAKQPGTESWNLLMYVGTVEDGTKPEYYIRGISEGTINSELSGVSGGNWDDVALNDIEAIVGVELDSTNNGGDEDFISLGLSGSVSAGQIGTAEFVYADTVVAIGGSTGPTGSKGSAQVSIPYTEVWT